MAYGSALRLILETAACLALLSSIRPLEAIAEQLAMSSKTLERRLAEQGQSFSTLLDRTRFDAVTHYLQDPDMRLTQIAYLAGYTEPATLVRAFKRWTGETPSKFRERPRSSMSD